MVVYACVRVCVRACVCVCAYFVQQSSVKSSILCHSLTSFCICLKDFDSWFDTHNCLENVQLVERLHAVSNHVVLV